MLEKIREAQQNGNLDIDFTMDEKRTSIYNPVDLLDRCFKKMYKLNNDFTLKNSNLVYKDINGKERVVDIYYQEEFAPEHFLIRQNTNDGTLCFEFDMIMDILENIIEGTLYYKDSCPKNYIKNPFDYDTKYILGNIYTFNNYVFPWVKQTIILPIKIEYNRIGV